MWEILHEKLVFCKSPLFRATYKSVIIKEIQRTSSNNLPRKGTETSVNEHCLSNELKLKKKLLA